jgi:hypothetical protein
MKNLVVLLMILAISSSVFAQSSYEDVVYLKNGSIVRGLIIEQVPNESVKIQTYDNNIFVFKMEEIMKMAKEQKSGSTKGGSSGGKRSFMGFTIGLNIANLTPDNDKFAQQLAYEMNNISGFDGFSFTAKSRYGLNLGMFYYGKVTKSFFIQAGMDFSMQGMVLEGSGKYYSSYSNYYDVDVKESLRLNYLNFPICAKYFVFDKGAGVAKQPDFNIYFLAGPNFGFAVGKTIAAKVTMGGETNEDTQTIEEGFKSFSTSLDFGGGVEISNLIDLELRYSLGLSKVTDDDANNTMKLKNSVFSVRLGFTFPL